jgi:F-type H+-transporting ATPase subunit gamma
MARIQEIATQIGSLKELNEIVAAIRAMAAVQMQQGQRSLGAIRSYVEIIRGAFAEAAALLSDDGEGAAAHLVARPSVVVFCSEHGFCGAFNEPLIRAVEDFSRRAPECRLIFVGTRGAQRASERGTHPSLTLPMATHTGGVGTAARRVAAELYSMLIAQMITSVEVFYMRGITSHEISLQTLSLLPLSAPAPANHRSETGPLLNMDPRRLRDEIGAEYMFAMLEAAAMESFTSENAARFRMMEAAHENIDKKSSELNRLLRRMRQETVTAEVLEIISGTEAIKVN